MKQPNTSSSPTANLSVAVRSALYYIGLASATLVFAPIMLLSGKRPLPARQAIALAWIRISLWMLENICGLTYQVHGLENVPAKNGVILSKHQSAWEALHFPAIFPPLTFLLKQELLSIPLWGPAMAKLEPIAIDRSAKTAAMKKVLRDGVARLGAGLWVVVFPEGTRVAPGQRGHYNTSGAILAHRAGCPVLPVAHNSGEFWRRNAFFKFPGVIQVHVGPPLDSSQLSAAELNQQAEGWIEAKMAEISPALPAAA